MVSTKHGGVHIVASATATLLFVCSIASSFAIASEHYTARQLEALASRIGKQYWINIADGQKLAFLTAPAKDAASFHIELNTSFEIKEIVQGDTKDPYYKVQLASGQEGYIRPETFFEELNLTFFSIDPQASDKRKEAAAAEEEQKRIAWIQAQPWSQAVKEAAIGKQAVPGMRTHEIRKVIGQPARTSKIRRPQATVEEQWVYADGSVLIFHNGLLTRIERSAKRNP